MLSYASHFDPIVVARSIAIAVFGSFVALDLAKRMQSGNRTLARRWWFGGSVVLGTGIWSMHFLGMLAFSLPIAIGYTPGLTLLSWCAATAVSAVALTVASAPQLPARRLAIAATTMGAGIFAMHYLGMAAIDMAPGIVWDPALVAASFAIAVAASAAALRIFFWLRTTSGARGVVFQLLAALVMGLAISGMHYTGMAAASFPAGSICLSADGLGGEVLQRIVSGSTLALLAITLLASGFDARLQSNTARIAASLRVANVALEQERERFHALTTLSSDWFWEQDPQGRITTLVNSVALTAGLAREDFLGKTIMELGWRPVDVEGWPRFRDVLQRHETFHDWQLQRADAEGRMHFISNSGAPVVDDAGAFTGYRGVGRDITPRKRDERRHLLQYTATRLLADSTWVRGTLPEVIGAICTTCHWQGGLFLSTSGHDVPSESAFWAEPGAESTFENLVDCRDRPERGQRAAAAGLRNTFSCQVRAGDQVLGELEFHFRAPLDDAALFFDSVRGIGLQLGDFIARCNAEVRLRGERELLSQRVAERTAELSRSNRDLEAARARAEDASRAKSDFLATMSHEIRTPMNGVVGMIDVLDQGELDAGQRDAIRIIRSSSFSLLSLIDDILEFTRAGGGTAPFAGTPSHLRTVIEGTCDGFAAEARSKHVAVDTFVSSHLPEHMIVDAARLDQALRKLLSNAIKFSAGRGTAGHVSVRVEASATEPGRLVVTVADDGIGMDAATIANLFVPFSQAESTTTRRYGGAGLGLVVCKRRVEAMGGTISVTSEPGAGSVFTVVVPWREGASLPEPRLSPRRAAVARRDADSIALARAEGRLILVAEDDPINQKVVLMQLELLGHVAEVASDGAEALRLWHRGGHALVLSDLHMPELDGYDLARAIRAEQAPGAPRVPILALTADATSEAGERVREAGMDAHLTKPLQLAVLREMLERWLPHPDAPARLDAHDLAVAAPRTPLPGPTVDVSVLKELVGDDPQTVRGFLAEFLATARTQAAEILASCAASDGARVGFVAHKLKSSSRSVGALALGDLCADLENASHAGSRDDLVDRCQRFARAMVDVDACIVETLAQV